MNLQEINIEDIKNALLGTIFADGSIGKVRTDGSKNGTNGELEITHTSKNLDYLKLIKQLLEKIEGIKVRIAEHNKKTETKTYMLYRLCTNRHVWFTELRKDIYDSSRIKLFPKEYIDKFNTLSLLFLYLDDGTLKIKMCEGTSKIREARITFCLDSFTLEELNYFRTTLKNKYNIDSHIYRHSKMKDLNRGFRIWLNTLNTTKFMTIIDEYYNLVPSMQYKFTKYYSL